MADILPLNGNVPIEKFIDFLFEVERFIDLLEIQPNKMVKLAVHKLKSEAAVMWDQMHRTRTRQGRELVRS